MELDFSRREMFRGAGVVAGGALFGPGADAGEADASTGVTEGTNISASASPDGRWVAFDLVTSIWTVPVTGGVARRLTDDLTDATRPCWSPDARTLVFQACRDGNYHLWTVASDGSGLRQLTSSPFDHREPRFAPDGCSIAFSSDRGDRGGYDIFTLDLATGGVITAVTAPEGASLYGPSFTPRGLAYVRIAGATAELVVGDQVVSSGEDVFGFAASWLPDGELLCTADGRTKRRAPEPCGTAARQSCGVASTSSSPTGGSSP